jgi:hypothetical protein
LSGQRLLTNHRLIRNRHHPILLQNLPSLVQMDRESLKIND